MKECELLAECGFFNKYKETKDLACSGFMILYCKGDKKKECERKKYHQENGKFPSDDMMPNIYELIEGG